MNPTFPASSHLYAKKLNNSAASCIEIGYYSRAITALQKALVLNKHFNTNDKGREVCKCYNCALDGCIDFSENSPSIVTTAICEYSSNSKKKRKITLSTSKENFWKPPNNNPHEDSDDGHIYRRPIRVDCECHNMGSTLYLIATFNMALAHHLQAIGMGNTERREKIINKTLVLYKLAYKWQMKLIFDTSPSPSCSTVTSIRFNMIIRNNVSQIYSLVNNHAKHKRCLQHLLSIVMVVMEYRTRPQNNRVSSSNTKDPRYMELDGFLQNVTPLMLQQGHCADAA